MDKPCKPTTDTKKPLKPWHKVFIAEYLNNGSNATQAYLKAKPGTSYENARARGSEAIAKSDIRIAIDKGLDKQVNASRFTKDQILDNIDVIREKTLEEKKYATSLKANKELAELSNLYDRGADDPGMYMTLINSLTVNTTISSDTTKELEGDDSQVIDITPEKE